MSKSPWLFDPDKLRELDEDAHDPTDMVNSGWSDWKSYFGGEDALFETPSRLRKSRDHRSREDLLRRHHRLRWERSHHQR